MRKDVVCGNGVHLTAKRNSFAAVSLCCRIEEGGRRGGWSEAETADCSHF